MNTVPLKLNKTKPVRMKLNWLCFIYDKVKIELSRWIGVFLKINIFITIKCFTLKCLQSNLSHEWPVVYIQVDR